MNGYELTSNFYNYKFDSNGRVKHTHADLYFYIIDLWNRLGQKSEFGLPTTVAMNAVGMGSYNTYKVTLNDLIEFGFIKLVKDSNNQHSAKIIALSFYDEPTDKPSIKPLDKATIKASNEPTDKPTDKPTDTIIEQEIINYKQEIKRLKEESEFSKNENYALLSENELIKSELEKAKEIIKALEEKPKSPTKKDVKIFDELVYDFPENFSQETKDVFMKFLANRKKMNKEVKTQRALNGLIEKLKPFDDSIRIIAIDNSINANWMDLFPKPEQRAGFDYSKHNSRNGYSNQSIPIRTPTPYVYDNSKD